MTGQRNSGKGRHAMTKVWTSIERDDGEKREVSTASIDHALKEERDGTS